MYQSSGLVTVLGERDVGGIVDDMKLEMRLNNLRELYDDGYEVQRAGNHNCDASFMPIQAVECRTTSVMGRMSKRSEFTMNKDGMKRSQVQPIGGIQPHRESGQDKQGLRGLVTGEWISRSRRPRRLYKGHNGALYERGSTVGRERIMKVLLITDCA